MNTNSDRKCLLLNCDFTPICIIDWRKSIVWSLKAQKNNSYGIQIIEFYDDNVLCANGDRLQIPAVARTSHYRKIYKNDTELKLSRKNLFLRDNYTCQYCGKNLTCNQLTYDHVIPKSRFTNTKTATSWTNVVTACKRCNAQKGNKTPKEARMELLENPFRPKFATKYLPWYTELSTIVVESTDIWEKYITKYMEE